MVTSWRAAGYMLGTPSIRRYSSALLSQPRGSDRGMGSDNPTGAGNQQERPGIEQWVVGFVDREQPSRRSSGTASAVVGETPARAGRECCSVLRTQPIENRKAEGLRALRRGLEADGDQRPSEASGTRGDRSAHGAHESPETVSLPGILRGHTPANSAPTAELKIWSEPHGDMGSDSSEIPCRVSSDLHEWRNDLGTVSTTDSVKLQCE